MAGIAQAPAVCANVVSWASAKVESVSLRSSSFLSGTTLTARNPSLALYLSSSPRGTLSVSAIQAVEERTDHASSVPSSVPEAIPKGLLSGGDPAWKIGTEEKARLKIYYETAVVPTLTAEFQYKNVQEVPRVEKVVVNCGIGDASQSAKVLEGAAKDLAAVTGQRPVVTRARKAIAGFKLRAGVPVGMSVTLRGQIMYSYLDRLVNLALPRMRDFQGLSRGGFDGQGNYSMGIPEVTVFPEIRYEDVDKARGMDITIVTNARNDREGQRLLELLGLPFKEGPAPVKERPKTKGYRKGSGSSKPKPKAKSKKK